MPPSSSSSSSSHFRLRRTVSLTHAPSPSRATNPRYYCPPNSTTPRPFKCGGVDRYCPRGSGKSTYVSSGYYTAGNEGDLLNLTRTRQVLCTAGSFCIIGVRHLCPAGTYGNRSGETGTRLLDVPHLSTLRSARRTDGAAGTASTIIEPADNNPHEHYNDDEQSHYAKQRGHGSVRTTEGGFNRDGIVHHAASSFCSGWCPAVRCCSARARERQNTEEAFPFARPSSHFLPPFLLLSTLRVTTARLAQWRRSRANRVRTQRKVPQRALIALRHDTALLAQWWPTHRFPLREHRCTQSALTQSTAAHCEGR